jgi:hypothetical protein
MPPLPALPALPALFGDRNTEFGYKNCPPAFFGFGFSMYLSNLNKRTMDGRREQSDSEPEEIAGQLLPEAIFRRVEAPDVVWTWVPGGRIETDEKPVVFQPPETPNERSVNDV